MENTTESPHRHRPALEFAVEKTLSVDEFLDILDRSTLAERRPVDRRDQIAAMISGANLLVTCRCEGLLVGISRALTDFAFCVYLSDLAVDQAFQGQGIGRTLIERTHQAAGLQTTLILIAAPKAESYYPHIGLQPHPSCWIRRPCL